MNRTPRPAPATSLLSILRALVAVAVCASAVLLSPQDAQAESIITQPEQHDKYTVEIEPHFYLRYPSYGYGAVGVGPGVRAAIPFLQNGPLKNVNNSMAVSFGVDFPLYRGAWAVDMPVACQWNFYFLDKLSAFGELGVLTSIFSSDTLTRVYVRSLVQAGARYQFTKMFGVIARVGYPSLSIGASIKF